MKLSMRHFKILAFLIMKTALVSSFNASAYASYDQTVVQTASNDRWESALSLSQETPNSSDENLVIWMHAIADIKGAQANESITANDVKQLILSKPHWPSQDKLKVLYEAKIDFNINSSEAIEWFNAHPPETGRGIRIFLSALENEGHWSDIEDRINEWWPVILVKPEDQSYLLKRYGRVISEDSHKERLSKLISRGHYTNARKIAKILGSDYQKLAEARIAINRDIKNDRAHSTSSLAQKIRSVPKYLRNREGLQLDRLEWRRKRNLNSGAIEILSNAPDIDSNHSEWWRERHILIRRMLKSQDFHQAYSLAAGHKQKGDLKFVEAEWLAGWIALEYLNQPSTAQRHFHALESEVRTPISLSRMHYWLGRSYKHEGDESKAKQHFDEAARYPTAYYGMLARQYADNSKVLNDINASIITSDDRANLDANSALQDLLRTAEILYDVGYRNSSLQFYMKASQLGYMGEKWKTQVYVAEYAKKKGKDHVAVLISRRSAMDHAFLQQEYSYPVILEQMVNERSLEWTIVHGIIRQESVFDSNAQSSVGARGLMQLMPATARSEARKQNKSYKLDWLKDRPEYNISLGSGYLEGLLEEFDGAYPLAIAAYNAGPHRVKSWLNDYGDPRDNEISWINWIELIPFSETRNYVMRVLEGIDIYGYILKDALKPDSEHIQLSHILYRGSRFDLHKTP